MCQRLKFVHRIEEETEAHRAVHEYHGYRPPAVVKSRASEDAGLGRSKAHMCRCLCLRTESNSEII